MNADKIKTRMDRINRINKIQAKANGAFRSDFELIL
jgi:hypothetical protein